MKGFFLGKSQKNLFTFPLFCLTNLVTVIYARLVEEKTNGVILYIQLRLEVGIEKDRSFRCLAA